MKNPLQEHLNLFYGFEYKAEYTMPKFPSGEEQITQIREIDGEQIDKLEKHFNAEPIEYWAKDTTCTLIARPISDMSDEEKRDIFGQDYHVIDYRTVWRCLLADHMIGLLSIRVYPFNPKDLEDGTVISKAELKAEV